MRIENWPWPLMFGTTVISQTFVGGTPIALIPFAELQRHQTLRESAQKAAWAAAQLQRLRDRINSSNFDTDYIAILRATLDRTTGRHVYAISEIPPLDAYCTFLSLTAADLIGNIRSSLEYLTWRLACDFCDGNPPDPKAVQFPICDTLVDFQKQERLKKQLHPDAFAFIESYQPYHGTNSRHDSYFGDYVHPLAHLRNMSNEEKHRVTKLFLMLPTQIWYGPVQLAGHYEEVMGQRLKRPVYDFVGTQDPIRVGMPVLSVQLEDAPDVIERAGSVNPHVALPGNRPMVESIERILTYVHMVLSDFARRFP